MTRFGAERRVFERLGSTQDAAREAKAQGAAEGTLILAEQQDDGRGRWGRRWEGRPGQSLLMTVLLKAETGAAHPGSLTLLLGVATAQALQGLGLQDAGLKWPNDLWWRERKLGGILVEGDGTHWFAGLGLNCLQAAEDFPPELRDSSASLKMAGLMAERSEVLEAVLSSWQEHLGRWRQEGAAACLAEYEGLDRLKGRLCRVRSAGRDWEGRADGVEHDGSLRLLDAQGGRQRFQSAEIELLRPLEGEPHG